MKTATPTCPRCGALLQHVLIRFPNAENHPGWRCHLHGAQIPAWLPAGDSNIGFGEVIDE